jgi:hypothetical protein
MSITAARGPRRGGRCGRTRPRRRRSARSARQRRRSSPALPRPVIPGLGPELAELNTLRAAHGEEVSGAALDRAVAFGRWRAADVRSILAAGAGTADPRIAGDALVLELPVVPVRPLSDYALGGLS